MVVINIAIFVLTCTGTLFLCKLKGLNYWSQALFSRPEPAFLVVAGLLSTFIGGTAADASSLIPDATRTIRILVLATIFMVSVRNINLVPGCWSNAGTGIHWMFYYALFAISSAIYSVGPLISVYKGLEYLVLVTAAISIAGQLRNKEDIQWLLDLLSLILLFLAISVLLGAIIAPGEAFRAASAEAISSAWKLTGVLGRINPTSVGGFGALLLVSALAPALGKNSNRSKSGLWIVVGIAFAVILLAHARTAIFGGAIAVAAILIYNRQKLLAITIILIGTLIVLLSSFGDVFLSYIYRGQSQELFLSMSGRTHYWGIFFDKYLESPILGHGYYAAVRVLYGTSSVDNSYLEVLLGLGLVGIVLFAVPVLYIILALLRTRPRGRDTWEGDILWLQITALAIIIITRSAVGASFQILHHLLIFFLIIQISVAMYLRLWKAHKTGYSLPAKPEVVKERHNDNDSGLSIIPARRKTLLTKRPDNK